MTVSLLKDNWSWDSVCVIGIGGHAKDKLLPAIEKAGLKIAGTVSRNSSFKIKGLRSFSTISEAVSNLPENTLFIISSPPSIHYSQVKTLIEARRDVFVEKPAFLSLDESYELTSLALKYGVILVEMLMYLENKSVQQIIFKIKAELNNIKNINSQFLLPSIPKGTFRTGKSIGNSLLSDMACYPLSLLAIADIDLSNLSLVFDNDNDTHNELFFIEGKSKQINIKIKIGLSKDYLNIIKIKYGNGHEICCEPFFYARDGYRKITKLNGERVVEEQIYETNSYELMFKRKRPEWHSEQKSRFNTLNLVSSAIERLGRQAKFD